MKTRSRLLRCSLVAAFLLCVPVIAGREASALLVDDAEVARFLSKEEEQFILQEEEDGGRKADMMQRCGNRNPCDEGFQCTQMGIGNRCFPTKCLQEELNAMEFDGRTYKEELFAKAGITEEQLVEEVTAAAKIRKDRNDLALGDNNIYQAFMKVLKENDEPLNRMREVQRKCSKTSSSSSVSGKNATKENRNDNRVVYNGLKIELGPIAEFTVTLLDADMGDENDDIQYNRICFGAGPQLLGQVAVTSTIVTNSDDPDSIACGSLWADVDLLLGIGAGAAAGVGFNGRTMTEISFGIGVGAGGGVSTCATWKAANNP